MTQSKSNNPHRRSEPETRSQQHRDSVDSAYGSGTEESAVLSYRRADGAKHFVFADCAYWNDGASGDERAAMLMEEYARTNATGNQRGAYIHPCQQSEYVYSREIDSP